MKRMYDFGRMPAKRNYTVRDLKELKGSGTVLSMSNPANEAELRACLEAEIDLLVVWAEQLDACRRIAPTQFMGTGSTWAQFGTSDEILVPGRGSHRPVERRRDRERGSQPSGSRARGRRRRGWCRGRVVPGSGASARS